MYLNEWNQYLNAFKLLVVDKVYSPVEYSIWRSIYNTKGYDLVEVFYDKEFSTITITLYPLDLQKNKNKKIFNFNKEDGSLGTFLYAALSLDFLSTSKSNSIIDDNKKILNNKEYNYDKIFNIKEDWINPVPKENNIDWSYTPTITSDSLTASSITTTTASPSLTETNMIAIEPLKLSDWSVNIKDCTSSINELTTEVNKCKKEIEKLKQGRNNSMNMFSNFDFGKVNGDNVRMSMYGIAVKNSAGTWVSYNSNNGEIVDVDIMNFNGSNFMYKVPVALNQVKVGDVVIHNRKPMFVIGIDNNKFTAVDVMVGEEKTVLPTKNMFGFNFITKVISFMDFNGENKPSENNPFGNAWMFMLNSDENMSTEDMLALMMMTSSNGNFNFMNNPMLMMLFASENNNNADGMKVNPYVLAMMSMANNMTMNNNN